MRLWLPREESEAILARGEGIREASRVINEFYPRLRAIDPRFDMFLQTERTDELKQGFWYVIRRNEDGTTAFFEVSNPDGSYREPDEAVLEMFRRNDANSKDNTFWEFRKRVDREYKAKKREQERQREDLSQELKERMDYEFRTQIAPHAPLKDGRLRGRR